MSNNFDDLKLQAPQWDCNWYIGFGYLQNENTHTHLNYYLDEIKPNANIHDQIEALKHIPEVLKNDKVLWRFCELFKNWLTLKEAYEFYNRGGSHYTSNGLNLQDYDMAVHILKDLFKVVNEICTIFHLKKLEFNEKIKMDVYNNMFPSTFIQNPDKTARTKWIMDYINKYDHPENHTDKIIPNKVVIEWKKEAGKN